MRPIDADALENFLRETRRKMKPENYNSADAFYTMDGALLNIAQTVHAMPTVDAVPVVRCRDCRFFNDGDCTQVARLVGEQSYCDLGERKE